MILILVTANIKPSTKEVSMQRRELVRILKAAGFVSKGGTNHEKFYKDGKMVLVKRHREIEDQIAKRILREAGLR